MKIYYDSEHDACSVEFDEDDSLDMGILDGKIYINSFNGGKPEIIEKQLLFSMDELGTKKAE